MEYNQYLNAFLWCVYNLLGISDMRQLKILNCVHRNAKSHSVRVTSVTFGCDESFEVKYMQKWFPSIKTYVGYKDPLICNPISIYLQDIRIHNSMSISPIELPRTLTRLSALHGTLCGRVNVRDGHHTDWPSNMRDLTCNIVTIALPHTLENFAIGYDFLGEIPPSVVVFSNYGKCVHDLTNTNIVRYNNNAGNDKLPSGLEYIACKNIYCMTQQVYSSLVSLSLGVCRDLDHYIDYLPSLRDLSINHVIEVTVNLTKFQLTKVEIMSGCVIHPPVTVTDITSPHAISVFGREHKIRRAVIKYPQHILNCEHIEFLKCKSIQVEQLKKMPRLSYLWVSNMRDNLIHWCTYKKIIVHTVYLDIDLATKLGLQYVKHDYDIF